MPDPKQLPHLIRLLDDESEVVQERLLEELESYGPALKNELARLNISPRADVFREIHTRLEEHNRKWLRKEWPSWLTLEGDKDRLERALSLLADFQNGRAYPAKLGPLLDQLTDEFSARCKKVDPRELSDFLFKKKHLRGTQSDYYSPLNSNLVYVIEQQRGIPISLACIYILVGHRLDLDIEGINTPGHFLARADINGKVYLVDCYNGGRFLDESDVMSFSSHSPVRMSDVLQLECDADTIISRFLRNLATAYNHGHSPANAKFMAELLDMIQFEDEEPEE